MRIILAIIFSFIGLLILLFFGRYSGDVIKYSNWYPVLGLVLLASSFFLIRYENHKLIMPKRRKKIKLKRDSKSNKNQYKKHVIQYEYIDIIANDYYEEQEIYGESGFGNKINMLNALTDETRNVKIVHINQCRLLYEQTLNGKKLEYFSEIIKKDKITISFILENQKEIDLYINKRNNRDFYFDLTFIK